MRRGGLLQGDYKGRLPAFEKSLLALLYEITSKKESKFFFSPPSLWVQSTFFRADSMPWDKNRSIFFKLKAPQKQRSTLGHSFSYVNQAFILKKQLSLINLFSDKCWYFWNPSKWAIIKTFISNSQKRHKMNRKSWIWF